MHRRNFIFGSGLLILHPAFALTKTHTTIIAASDNAKGQHFISWFDGKLKQVKVPHRGHGLAFHPLKENTVLLFGRRPQRFCYEINLQQQRISHEINTNENYHFCGHGCFSRDGQRLFTTEMNQKTTQGMVCVRDSVTYKKLAEYDSGGIDPHDIHLLNHRNQLVVANGGILTRPDTGRKKLNLATMQSNLVLLDADTGQKQQVFSSQWQQASLRHLSVAKNDTIAIGMQYQREAVTHQKTIPLTGFLTAGAQKIQFNHAPELLIQQLNDYVGSVVVNDDNGVVGFSSPKGNMVAFWKLDGNYVGHHRMHDVCGLGLSQDKKHFILNNSRGELRYLTADGLKLVKNLGQQLNTRWDNHFITS